MQPEFEDENAINPFDFWKGANLKLKIRKVEGYRNYDKSEFDSVTALNDSDDALKAIWEKQHSLQEFLDPKNFKSYEELKNKLQAVLSSGVPSVSADEVELSQPEPVKQASAPKKKEVDTDEDEDLSYFAKLAEES